ncbi:MAG: hypothetical protein KA713_18700 [Chryseotalea sp. WA131a]|nr:MAG: hypothetical protein KA713_18700 [Chryseotalea sp. WA131a]
MSTKLLSLFLIILVSEVAHSQENFIPSRPDHVSESEYRRGSYILENSYKQLAENNYHIVYADYWNFAMAYSIMGQPKELIYDFLVKAKFENKKSFCQVIELHHDRTKGVDSSRFYKLLGEDYIQLIADCSQVNTTEESFNIEEYIAKNRYNKELIYRLNALAEADQRIRGKRNNPKLDEQQAVDKRNMKEAESIIEKYGYPGTSVVGSKFDFVVWLVIQHADLLYQEKYLPLIAKTVEAGELAKVPLRMLIDSIYHKKTGQQIFGSQGGVPFADDKTIQEVKKKYNL